MKIINEKLGGGGVQVQGQGKGQQLMGIIAVNFYIWLVICQSKIYKKHPPLNRAKSVKKL